VADESKKEQEGTGAQGRQRHPWQGIWEDIGWPPAFVVLVMVLPLEVLLIGLAGRRALEEGTAVLLLLPLVSGAMLRRSLRYGVSQVRLGILYVCFGLSALGVLTAYGVAVTRTWEQTAFHSRSPAYGLTIWWGDVAELLALLIALLGFAMVGLLTAGGRHACGSRAERLIWHGFFALIAAVTLVVYGSSLVAALALGNG